MRATRWFEGSARLGRLPKVVAVGSLVALGSAVGCTSLRVAAGGGPRDATLQHRLAGEPSPLRGIPLRGKTGIRLLVSAKPKPLVLDVDSGSTRRVRGVPSLGRYGEIEIVGVRGRAGVVIATPLRRRIRIWPRGRLYAVRKKGAWLSALGAGDEVVAAADGGSVWVKRYARLPARSCTLREVRLDGRVMRAPRAFRCPLTIYPGGALGLGVSPTRVIDPVTGRTVFRTRSWEAIVAIAGREVVLEERAQDRAGQEFGVLDSATGALRRIAWPDTEGALEHPSLAVSPPIVALGFANPIGRQVWDVWALDTETATLTELPDMPAFVAVKRANMAWTRDGRLVLLAESAGKDAVAVWRPGQERLQVKTVRLPGRRNAGSDTFAILGP
jgi:hypothetical protein